MIDDFEDVGKSEEELDEGPRGSRGSRSSDEDLGTGGRALGILGSCRST